MKTLKNLILLLLLGVATAASAQQRYLTGHPRLLFTAAEEAAVGELIRTDTLAAALAAHYRAEADSLCTVPQLEYQRNRYGESLQLLHISRAYVYRLGTLSLAYRLYGEQKYVDAADEALLWVCRHYPDWNPSHYLDTAEMATAVAIAYDWMYDALPPDTKKLVKQCLYERAIARVLREYEVGQSGSWAKRETNWNVVCNTGMTLAALAVAEDYPRELATVLDNTARYMPRCLQHFAPDGVCYEGPAYWGYTTSFLSLYLKAVADNDHSRGGIGLLPGIDRTALYQKRTLSPTGRIFNFANSGVGVPLNPAFFYFSRRYAQPEVAAWYRDEIGRAVRQGRSPDRLSFLDLPWFDAAPAAGRGGLPRLEVYRNPINDIIVMNGNRTRRGSLFLIAKGGEPAQAHQHMDGGTFLVESEGVCWTEDLGSDSYGLKGFWDYRPDGQRWTYIRNSNLSHNTLSIDNGIQYSPGEAFVCEADTSAAQPFARLDMTSLYREQADRVIRTFRLVDDFTAEVEDEIHLLHPQSTVAWRAVTYAEVSLDGRRVLLRQDGKEFRMELLSPSDATFESFPLERNFEEEKPISGVTVIQARCTLPAGAGKVVVRMSSGGSALQLSIKKNKPTP